LAVRLIVNRSAPEAGRIFAIANQKGGVGKTTTAINLGTALAACGKTVLMIDLDPQGNASTSLGIQTADRKVTTYDVMLGRARLGDAVVSTRVPGFEVVPSVVDLSAAEIELVERKRREFALKDALTGLDKSYDYVLIDCPPSLGLLTVNALVAAQSVLVPLQCEFFALEGLGQLLQTVEHVRQTLNRDLTIHGIALTMYDSRNNLSAQVVADVRDYMGDKVYQTVIPRNVRVSEAPSHGKPVLIYDLKCAGSQAYLRLASEIIQREKQMSSAA
jgi:chromosome partitioning protein